MQPYWGPSSDRISQHFASPIDFRLMVPYFKFTVLCHNALSTFVFHRIQSALQRSLPSRVPRSISSFGVVYSTRYPLPTRLVRRLTQSNVGYLSILLPRCWAGEPGDAMLHRPLGIGTPLRCPAEMAFLAEQFSVDEDL